MLKSLRFGVENSSSGAEILDSDAEMSNYGVKIMCPPAEILDSVQRK